ncbi:MAG: hypothetical protein ACQXXJ_04045, partial [Candidatus Bathyarchaeia archaeon]
MKIGIKLLVAAILSMFMGIACASPLLLSELNIQPYPLLPEGPKPEVTASVVYACFSAQIAAPSMSVPSWYPSNQTPTTINYKIVVNVTNPSDEYVVVDFLQASAAQDYLRGDNPFLVNGVTGTAGSHRYVYLDGELVNVTWIPNAGVPMPPQPVIGGYPTPPPLDNAPLYIPGNNSATGGYWREGVEIADTYVNGTLAYTYMLINGTWIDVTGRVEVPDRENPFNQMVIPVHHICSGWYTFQAPLPSDWNATEMHTRTSTQDFGNGTTVTTTITTVTIKPTIPAGTNRTVDNSAPQTEHVTIYMGPGKFNNTWAPHESRLIMLNGTVFNGDA